MNIKFLTVGAIISTALWPSFAQAGTEASDFEFSGNAALTSEYSFRGIAQSDEHPALQGGFDVSHSSGFYAGIWGSNVDFNDGDEASLELDIYGGYSGALDKLNYDLGLIYYVYPGADSALDYDFVEGAVAVGYDFDLFSASASINYSPEYFADSGDAFYYAAAVAVPLPYDLTLSGHVGYQTIDDNAAFGTPDYTDWSLGIDYDWNGFGLSAQYVDTDLDEPGECADGCSSRLIFTVSRSF